MKKFLLILLTSIFSYGLFAQTTWDMASNNGATIYVDSLDLFTPGSITNGNVYTTTVCASDGYENHHIVIRFSGGSLSIPQPATICIYDGPDVSYPLIACYDNSNISSNMAFTATCSNVTGCLTIVLDAQDQASNISFNGEFHDSFCCQEVQIGLTTNPPMNGQYIDICQGDDIDMNLSVTFPDLAELSAHNWGYAQDASTCNYSWDMRDGTTYTTQNITHHYDPSTPQGYNPYISVTDVMGCPQSNVVQPRVRMSLTPSFQGTGADPWTLCQGDPTTLTGQTTSPTYVSGTPPVVCNEIDLPDGNGVVYNSEVIFNIFQPNATLTDISQLVGITAQLYHTFAADLHITIECPPPAGHVVTLHLDHGNVSGANLGGGTSDCGDYTWSPTATNGTWNDNGGGTQLPPGTYESEESLTGLIGCPLNGTWILHIEDTWPQDAGHLCCWWLDFDPSLYATVWDYSMTYSPTSWAATAPNGTILSGGSGSTTATGTYDNLNIAVNETRPFTYTVTDNFGCTYDTTIHVTWMYDNADSCCIMPTPNAGSDETICGNVYTLNISNGTNNDGWTTPGNTGQWTVTPSTGVTFTNPDQPTTEVQVSTYGTYTFTWTETNGGCTASDAVTITFREPPVAYAGQDGELCGTTNNLHAVLSDNANANNPHTGWLDPNGYIAQDNNPTSQVTVPQYGTYTFFWVEDNGTCTDTSSVKIIFLEIPNVSVETPVDTCGSTIRLHADTAGMWGPNYHGVWTGITSNTTGAYFNPNDTTPDVEATIILPTGASSLNEQFQWTVYNGICSASAVVDVTFTTDPNGTTDVNPGDDDFICVSPDNVCYQLQAQGVGHWTIPTQYQSVVSIDDPTLPNATICVDTAQLQNGNFQTWIDSSFIKVPMKWTIVNNGCTVDGWVTIKFNQTPTAKAMDDQGICGQDIDLTAKYSIGNSTGEWSCISHTSTYYEFPNGRDTNIARVHANTYSEYTFVWTEFNTDNNTCNSTDTVRIEFIQPPTVSAGAPQAVCGDYAQLQAIEDTTSTGGQWHPAAVQWVAGIGDPTVDPLQQISPTAYVMHHTETQNCIDTIQFVWQQYTMGTVHPETQCVAKDTTYVYFVADIQAENQTYTQEEVCGRFIDLNSAQILPSCGSARAFWIDSLNNVINWLPENGLNTRAEVGAYTPNTFWLVVQNGGDINHPVCADTSAGTHVIFREQPEVNACVDCDEINDVILHNINGVNNILHIANAKTDTVCLRDGGYYLLNPWRSTGEGSWSRSRDGVFFANASASNPYMTEEDNDTVFVQVYNSNPGNSAGNAYILVYKAVNANNGCDAADTLIVSFAKIPSGAIEYARPYCYGDQAQVWAADDYDANPTGFNWKFYDETYIDSTTTGTSLDVDSLKKGPHFIHWPSYNDCDLLKHKVSLTTSSSWGCTSSRNDAIIEEPPLITPKYFEIPATCTQANGEIKVKEDSIVACGDTFNYSINTKWIISTSDEINSQIAVNPLKDSIYNVSPTDSTWLEINYITLLIADSTYTGSQELCKDTILVKVEDSGLIDAVIDENRTADKSPDASLDSKGNLTGYAPLALTLYTGTEEAKKYRWIIRDEEGNIIYESTAQYPTYTFGKGNYQVDLIVQSKEGCMDTTLYKFIIVDSESFLKIPNVFTPNGDGQNDYFQVYAKSIKAFKGTIFNRWGKVIYEWDDWTKPEKGWDGKIGDDLAAPGVYYYVIRYKGIYDEQESEEKGSLELVREK